jgi:hypothetical protein
MTLIELIVSVTLLAIAAGVSTLAFRAGQSKQAGVSPEFLCRRRAVQERREIVIKETPGRLVRCLPDGQVLGGRSGQFAGTVP